MSDFVAQIRGILDTSQVEAKLKALQKSQSIKLNVELTGNGIKSTQSFGKNYTSELQKQIDTIAKTQRNAFSAPLNNLTRQQKAYSDWWNKELGKQESRAFNSLNAETASNKTLTWLNNNTKAVKKYGDAFRTLAARQKEATSDKELKQYNAEYRNLISAVQKEGLTGRNFFSEMKRGFSQITQFVGTYAILQKSIQSVKKMFSAVLDVNNSMTELSKVSNASDLQLSAYFDEAAESAKKYGATISEVISSTADWSRLGYSFEDAKKLSDITTLYQRVGDNMTQEKASSSLVSTLQGFKLDADEAEHIVNAFNEVGNNFAIGSDGIGEALQRSASSMKAAGNTMEETIGLVTAANEVVQDPDRVGNAFKTKLSKNCLYVQKCA